VTGFDGQGEFDWESPLSIQERFESFDAAHPEVYGYLLSLCFDLRRRGWQHYGIKSLWERTRWHFQVEKDLGEEFKLNNNYHSRYARKIIAQYPEFEGFFELRELRAE
jgi:hypothetical protein